MRVSEVGITFAVVVALAGCSNAIRTADVEGELASGPDTCGATQYTMLIGEEFTVLNDAPLPDNRRVLFPGAAVGEEADETRINFIVDTEDTITEVYCG